MPSCNVLIDWKQAYTYPPNGGIWCNNNIITNATRESMEKSMENKHLTLDAKTAKSSDNGWMPVRNIGLNMLLSDSFVSSVYSQL